MKRVSIFFIVITLIAGMVGCVGGDGNNGGSYTLIIDFTAGGTVTVDDIPIPGKAILTYDAGTVVSVNAAPRAGYRFVEWTGNVSNIANVNAASTTITMNDDYSVIASFEVIGSAQYSLIISSTTGGSVSTPGQGTFQYHAGTMVDLVAGSEEGYKFFNWTGDIEMIANVNATSSTKHNQPPMHFSITMEGNYAITAHFIPRWFIPTG